MIDLGPHAAFIWLSYAAALLVVAGLMLWAFGGEARKRAKLTEMERRGITAPFRQQRSRTGVLRGCAAVRDRKMNNRDDRWVMTETGYGEVTSFIDERGRVRARCAVSSC